MPSPVISVSKLRKSYGSTVAVEDVSLDVNQGETFGLIGAERRGVGGSLGERGGVDPGLRRVRRDLDEGLSLGVAQRKTRVHTHGRR